MSQAEINSLHLLHEHFRALDDFLAAYNSDLVRANGTAVALILMKDAEQRLTKRLEHLRLIEAVLERHVAEDPLDVFNVSRTYDEVRGANYKMPSDDLAEFLLETQPARRLDKGPQMA